jgi:hypothetical protein
VQVQPDFYFYDISNKVSFRPTGNDLVSLSLYLGADQLDESSSSQFGGGGMLGSGDPGSALTRKTEDITNWGNRGASGRWLRHWGDRLSTDVLLAATRYRSENRTETSATGGTAGVGGQLGRGFSFAEDNVVDDLTLRLRTEYRASNRLRFELGSWVTRSDVSYQFDRLSSDTLSLDVKRIASGRIAGAHLEATFTPLRRLSLTAGLRGSHYDLTRSLYWEPRGSASLELAEGLHLKGAWGQHYQWITRVENEDVLQGSRDFWLLANDELLPAAPSTAARRQLDHSGFLFSVGRTTRTPRRHTVLHRYRRDLW